jgi:glycosyltransferase involved in cell wall biosynthesis
MTICLIAGQLGLGGAERQLYLLARELVVRRYEVIVVSFHGGRGDHWEEPLRQSGIDLITLPPTVPRWKRMRRIASLLRARRVRVVHAWNFSANLYAAICGRLLRGCARIGSERSNHNLTRKQIGTFWYSASLRGLDAMVTNSEFAATELRRSQPRLRVSVVPNAVELPLIPDSAGRAALRRELRIPEAAIVVAGVGSLFASKNFTQLIAAASRLAPAYPEIVVVLVGDGPERTRLEAKAAECGAASRVLFLGSVPNAARYMPVFDIVCLPAVGYEGLPNVLLEAGAAAVAAVASDVGGCGEAVVNGETGLLFPEGDEGALVERLKVLLSDAALRTRLGIAGRERVIREFNVGKMVDRMLEVYGIGSAAGATGGNN